MIPLRGADADFLLEKSNWIGEFENYQNVHEQLGSPIMEEIKLNNAQSSTVAVDVNELSSMLHGI